MTDRNTRTKHGIKGSTDAVDKLRDTVDEDTGENDDDDSAGVSFL
jgi:hypothetical protein